MFGTKLAFYLTEGSHGCLMAKLATADALPIREWAASKISEENLIDEGLEADPHVTVLYGFLPNVKPVDIKKACESIQKIDFGLGKISRFSTDPKKDVIKVEVISEDLHSLNTLMRKEFKDDIEVSYPDYKPHLTLAYVKKDAHPELNGHAKFEGSVYRLRELIYSEPDAKRKTPIELS